MRLSGAAAAGRCALVALSRQLRLLETRMAMLCPPTVHRPESRPHRRLRIHSVSSLCACRPHRGQSLRPPRCTQRGNGRGSVGAKNSASRSEADGTQQAIVHSSLPHVQHTQHDSPACLMKQVFASQPLACHGRLRACGWPVCAAHRCTDAGAAWALGDVVHAAPSDTTESHQRRTRSPGPIFFLLRKSSSQYICLLSPLPTLNRSFAVSSGPPPSFVHSTFLLRIHERAPPHAFDTLHRRSLLGSNTATAGQFSTPNTALIRHHGLHVHRGQQDAEAGDH